MKILHVTYDMRIGGTEMVIRSLIEGGHCSKFEMSIFCIESKIGPWGEMLKNSGIPIIAFDRKEGLDLTLLLKIRKYIRANAIDIVHCHQYTPWVYGVLAAAGTRAKVMFTEHGRFYPDRSSWKRKLINPLLSYLTDSITAISDATRKALVDFEFLSSKKIQLVYNGIEPFEQPVGIEQLRIELGISSDAPILGTISRFDPIKNHVLMLKAFKLVLTRFPNAVLIVVGDGEERQNIEACINRLAINDSVILTGYQVSPKKFLALMQIFLLSSLSEGASMTLLEAMSLQKPCVVTDAGGNGELIQHGYNGYVTENNNADAFAEAIIKLLEINSVKEFGQNGYLRFHELFTNTNMIKRYTSIYETLHG
ncbi:glycosyltransferase [Alteromonas sediminis]|uniref:Glycosyltransferase n=1 Tax=Alteromonas sediminis TaxID=2259342 RepID=A0A3N5Y5Y8_9ALTE|nr:glycosyltransferase [Alteromonas sediminis]RPJ65729.1 glycosyltransferase [Alteromonas sediminis]